MKVSGYKNKDFLKLLLGNTVSCLGDSMDNVIIMLLAINLTQSPYLTGLLMMIISLPNIVFSVIGGTVADSFKRKKILVIANILQGILVSVLLILVISNKINFLSLCVILFLLESLSRFHNPAYMSALSNVVKKQDFIQCKAMLSSSQSIVGMIGPAISSLLATISYSIPITLDAISYFFAGIMAHKTDIPEFFKKEDEKFNIEKFVSNTKEGFKYLKKNIILLRVFILIFFTNLFLGFFEVALPFFVKDNLKLSFEYYGYYKSMAIATFIIASTIIIKKKKVNPCKLSIFATLIMGSSVVLFGLSTSFWMSSFFWIIAAIFRCIIVLMLNSFYALIVEDEYRGRIIGINVLISCSIVPISNALSGVLVNLISAKFIFILCGIGLIIVSLVYLIDGKLFSYKLSYED